MAVGEGTTQGSRERIEAMEARLDAVREALDALAPALEQWADAESGFAELCSYYGSQAWHEDREAEAAGALGGGLKAGVLSEDLAYNAIVDARTLALDMIEAAARALRAS